MLNASKGPAVPRPSVPKRIVLFTSRQWGRFFAINLTLPCKRGEVVDLNATADGSVSGVTLADGIVLSAPAVVLTTGNVSTRHHPLWPAAVRRWS